VPALTRNLDQPVISNDTLFFWAKERTHTLRTWAKKMSNDGGNKIDFMFGNVDKQGRLESEDQVAKVFHLS
jgi:hypothetical protein